MTDYAQTTTNQLGIVGLGFPVYWGTMVWGTDVWGSAAPAFQISHAYTTTMTVSSSETLSATFDRVLANTMTVDSAQDLSVVWDRVIADNLELDSAVGKDATIAPQNNLELSSEMESVYVLRDAYYKVFPGGVTNALDKYSPTFTTTAVSTSFTTATKPTTTWS